MAMVREGKCPQCGVVVSRVAEKDGVVMGWDISTAHEEAAHGSE